MELILDAAKSKRYALARLRRMCLCAALGVPAELQRSLPPYARILALNDRGRALLHQLAGESGVPVLTKPAVLRERGGEEFRRRLTEATREIIGKEWVEPRQKNYDRTALRYFSLCAVHGFAAAVIQWLEEDMPETPRELADILGNVLDYGIDALRKGSQGNG